MSAFQLAPGSERVAKTKARTRPVDVRKLSNRRQWGHASAAEHRVHQFTSPLYQLLKRRTDDFRHPHSSSRSATPRAPDPPRSPASPPIARPEMPTFDTSRREPGSQLHLAGSSVRNQMMRPSRGLKRHAGEVLDALEGDVEAGVTSSTVASPRERERWAAKAS